MLGNEKDAIGYIQLSNFAQDTGREMRQAILYLQQRALVASNGYSGLQVSS